MNDTIKRCTRILDGDRCTWPAIEGERICKECAADIKTSNMTDDEYLAYIFEINK